MSRGRSATSRALVAEHPMVRPLVSHEASLSKRTATLVERDGVVAKLELARAALLEAQTVPEAKQVADAAAAVATYARRQRLGQEIIRHAQALSREALTKVGRLLQTTPRATGARGIGTSAVPHGNGTPPTLEELGLTRKEAMQAQQLAALAPDMWASVIAGTVTLTEARRQVRHAARPAAVFPVGKFRVLYADPPWQYRDTRAGLGESQTTFWASTAAADHYPTMTVEALSTLPVSELAAPDAVLFCWATFPLLPDSLDVVAAWGFTYKTAFVWAKPRGSFGHYHKADAELLLLATRGSCTPDSADERRSQIFTGPVTEHSRKPDSVRELIDALYRYGPRIEFVRPATGGCSVGGVGE